MKWLWLPAILAVLIGAIMYAVHQISRNFDDY